MRNKLLYIVLLLSFPSISYAGWFGPDNYEECMLERMKGQLKNMVSIAGKSCRNDFPEEIVEVKEVQYDDIPYNVFRKFKGGMSLNYSGVAEIAEMQKMIDGWVLVSMDVEISGECCDRQVITLSHGFFTPSKSLFGRVLVNIYYDGPNKRSEFENEYYPQNDHGLPSGSYSWSMISAKGYKK